MYMDRTFRGKEPSRPNTLFQAIGQFLSDQRLEPNPTNYGFAYSVLSNPGGPIAKAVALLTDGGIRLTRAEVEELGGQLDASRASAPMPDDEAVSALIATTERHVSGFETMMRAMQSETQGFGRDLAASQDAIRESGEHHLPATVVLDQLARITSAMRERVEQAEARLEQATHETRDLREKLAQAHGDARRDALTGLPNRRAFEEAFLNPGGHPRYLAICDVDHFKKVNDRYGHIVGDRVLKAIAATLARTCEGHMVARYGGEEFALLLTNLTMEDAHDLLETARRHVGQRHYRLREDDSLIEGVRLSAGMVVVAPGEVIDDALERADRLLYSAKTAGRDRLVRE